MRRYASIWFPHLISEFTVRKNPELREQPFVLVSTQRGRAIIDSASKTAMRHGIHSGMVLADGKAILPELQVLKSETGKSEKLLTALAEWCIGYTPIAAIDLPDGLILDTSGCSHLWGGESQYLDHIKSRLNSYGYTVKIAIANTIAMAWATARYGEQTLVKSGSQYDALRKLPSAALRLEPEALAKLNKLGLRCIGQFIDMPQSTLRRRFGPSLPFKLNQALGRELEPIAPVKPIEPYQQRLCSMEPICTAVGITIALKQLLQALCIRFRTDGVGLRHGIFSAYRIDGEVQRIEIGTGQASCDETHLFKLFEHKISTLQPDLGFEAFLLEAPKFEMIVHEQSAIWNKSSQNTKKIAELLDRVTAKIETAAISRFLPVEHYWPERAAKLAGTLSEKPQTCWRNDLPRPIHLLPRPETIEVMALLPDYPPKQFVYKGTVYAVVKSDGPERIEQEWWLADGLYRDYYCAEDESGARYWLFRSGPYEKGRPQWFIHGFFA